MLRLSLEGFGGRTWAGLSGAMAEYGFAVMRVWTATGMPLARWPKDPRRCYQDERREGGNHPVPRAVLQMDTTRPGAEDMVGAGIARIMVVTGLLTLVLVGCGGEEVEDNGHSLPEGQDEYVEDEFPRLSRVELERYHAAQLAWRQCAIGEGFDLPEPPTLDEFIADRGTWWVGADLSEEDWNRHIAGDGPGEGRLDRACGEPAGPHEFRVGRKALERLYAWQQDLVECLEREGFPIDAPAPPLEEFIRAAGTNWSIARAFIGRYGFPDGPTSERLSAACGTVNGDLFPDAIDFREVVRVG